MSYNKSITTGKGTFLTNLTNDRSAPNFGANGDPTLYADYHLQKASLGNQKSVNRRVRDGKIAFNSNSARCSHAGFEDNSPFRGPGTYSYAHLYSTAAEKSPTKGTNAFTNRTPLLGYIRKIDTPGAGEYDPQRLDGAMGFSYSALGSCSFAGNTARCAEGFTPAGSAGPETYQQDQHSISRMVAAKKNPRAPPFGSSSRRL